MKFLKQIFSIIVFTFFVISCSTNDDNPAPTPPETAKELTIFHINDPHASLENFSKIKYIIDTEKAQTNVIVVSGGDIFSGNPVVDNYDEKGFPMIDLMNKVGFDIAVMGNHEFDYGELILKDRLNQSQFDWVCANVNMNNTGIPEPFEYKTITKDNVKVTFLGLVETNGKEDAVIPSTHPWRVENLTFEKYYDVISNYATVKEEENADLYIALSHLGNSTDHNLAYNYPYFDLIIGGHSHSINDEIINNIPIFQAGSNLNFLGKIKLVIKDKKIESLEYQLIDLGNYSQFDSDLKELIDAYNDDANLDEVIGYASAYHSRSAVGSFYTDALRTEMNVDLTFQNPGGVRNSLNEGDITKREIYSIDPFNNGSVSYEMTVGEIKFFLMDTRAALYYSGGTIEQQNNTIVIKDSNGQILNDSALLTIGINDYIPAVYDRYFTQDPTFKPYTTAEALINYLNNNPAAIDYTQVNSYFQFE